MAEGEEDFVEVVVDTQLDIKKYTDLVRSPAAGAITTFSGTTRETFEDKIVLELRYEAYVPMALKQLRAICSASRDRWKLTRLAVAHRLGVVPVGEESVFVAVSSVHRRDALEACEYIIDEIKLSVPIWKKEVYTDGQVWKENSEFFLRKPGESEEEVSLKQHKGHEHFGCCGRKERVFENGSDDDTVSIWKKEVITNGEVWKENSEFFLRKPGESGEEVSLKQHKGPEHSGCCGRRERVFENGSDDNSHCEFEAVEEIENEP